MKEKLRFVFLMAISLTLITIALTWPDVATYADASESRSSEACDDCNILEERRSNGSQTVVWERGDQRSIFTEHNIEDWEDLVAYKEEARQRHAWASTGKQFFAAITFTSPLTSEEVEDLLKNVEVVRLRYISNPWGGGETIYPPDLERLTHLEQSVGESQSELNGIEDFVLVEGFVAAKVYLHANEIQELTNDERVFLVDIGAVDLAQKYGDATVWVDDVYYEYEKYGDDS